MFSLLCNFDHGGPCPRMHWDWSGGGPSPAPSGQKDRAGRSPLPPVRLDIGPRTGAIGTGVYDRYALEY